MDSTIHDDPEGPCWDSAPAASSPGSLSNRRPCWSNRTVLLFLLASPNRYISNMTVAIWNKETKHMYIFKMDSFVEILEFNYWYFKTINVLKLWCWLWAVKMKKTFKTIDCVRFTSSRKVSRTYHTAEDFGSACIRGSSRTVGFQNAAKSLFLFHDCASEITQFHHTGLNVTHRAAAYPTLLFSGAVKPQEYTVSSFSYCQDLQH